MTPSDWELMGRTPPGPSKIRNVDDCRAEREEKVRGVLTLWTDLSDVDLIRAADDIVEALSGEHHEED